MSYPSDNNTPTASQNTSVMTPQERLDSSRNALMGYMTRNNPPPRPNSIDKEVSRHARDSDNPDTGVSASQFNTGGNNDSRPNNHARISSSTSNTGSAFSLVRHALTVWWQNHPAHIAVDIARPLLSQYAKNKPVKFLAVSAGVGAVLVLIKPWRMATPAGILVGGLKSSGLSNILFSMLSTIGRK